jgi:Rod binding domain-containing protein
MQPISSQGPSLDLTHLVADRVLQGEAEGIRDLQFDGKDEAAAQAFEALFASMLVGEMRKSMPEGFFGSGPGSDVYGQWFDQHMGSALSADDGLGLAGMLRAQLGIEKLEGLEKAPAGPGTITADSAGPAEHGEAAAATAMTGGAQ